MPLEFTQEKVCEMLNQLSSNICVGRQPIFDKSQSLVAFELLYRDGPMSDSASVFDGDAATTNVLTNALFEIGLDRMVGESLAFVNFTKTFLEGTTTIPFEGDRIVIEVLENEEIDSNLIAGVTKLSEDGYRIALDDFIYSPKWDPLLEIADIVKLDILNMTEKEVADHVQLLKKFKVILLAEKVESYDQFAMCTELGFDLFQGYFFAKPNVFEEKRANASHAALLGTLAAVNDPEAGVHEIEAAVSQDAMLTYKFMRYVNSSSFGRRSKVESVAQAIVYLGKENVRTMANLLLLTSLDNKPPALINTALIRAIACQNLACAMKEDRPETFFAVGLLSMLDALLDRPLEGIVKELPVAESLQNALLERTGVLGSCLRSVEVFERAEQLEEDNLPLSAMDQYHAYQEAVDSVDQHEGLASLLPSLHNAVSPDAFRRKCFA